MLSRLLGVHGDLNCYRDEGLYDPHEGVLGFQTSDQVNSSSLMSDALRQKVLLRV